MDCCAQQFGDRLGGTFLESRHVRKLRGLDLVSAVVLGGRNPALSGVSAMGVYRKLEMKFQERPCYQKVLEEDERWCGYARRRQVGRR